MTSWEILLRIIAAWLLANALFTSVLVLRTRDTSPGLFGLLAYLLFISTGAILLMFVGAQLGQWLWANWM